MKNLLIFTLGILIGAGVFYYFNQKGIEKKLQTIDNFKLDTLLVSGKINSETANKMINAYNGLPISDLIVSSDLRKLEGFFIRKKDFMEIFLDNKIDGVYFNLALDEKFIESDPKVNALTLVFRGATINRNKTPASEPDFFTAEQFYDKIDPCPPHCN